MNSFADRRQRLPRPAAAADGTADERSGGRGLAEVAEQLVELPPALEPVFEVSGELRGDLLALLAAQPRGVEARGDTVAGARGQGAVHPRTLSSTPRLARAFVTARHWRRWTSRRRRPFAVSA